MILKNVIIIGPSVQRTKGGIASVIQGFTESNAKEYGYHLEHFISHVEGRAIEKLSYFLKCFVKILFTSKIALVHIHTACDASFYRKAIFALVCHLRGIPVIMHIHGADFDSFYLNANALVKTLIKKSLKGCNVVIVLSAYWKEFFESKLALNNIVILFNAVNVDAFKDCFTSPQNISAFLFLGRLGERKGIYDLIKAIDILINQEHLTQLQFYFAGDGDVAEVKKIISQLNLNEYVKVLGWADDKLKKDLFLKVDTVVLPSYNEGLPVALLEAMAAGKIILSTPVGGIPDLVKEGNNGFLVAPGDVNALVQNIIRIYQSPGEMAIISQKNAKKIQAEYNSIEINQQLFKLYDRVLTQKKVLTA
jgi:glycosyltransferase involved in cell wall biosynthesis